MSIVRSRNPALDDLRDLRLFHGCTEKQLSRVDSLVCPQDVPGGAVLCRQGTFGRQTFVIVSGQAEVAIDGVPIATLGPGSFFGEMSVLDRCRRVATVTALTPMTLLVLSSQELELLLADVPKVARHMLATMGSRLRLADRAFGERPELIASP
jgi:CRP/FNR family transcriptional regulator, cyclic AMP receptor protein